MNDVIFVLSAHGEGQGALCGFLSALKLGVNIVFLIGTLYIEAHRKTWMVFLYYIHIHTI